MNFRIAVLALILMAGPSFAQKAYIDYDQEYDFSKVKTFAWSKTSDTSVEKVIPSMLARLSST